MKGPAVVSNLSVSSQSALDWAYTWRESRPMVVQSQTSTEIDERDLLIGILRAHQDDSPPEHLLDYFQIPLTRLHKELEYDPQDLPGQSQPLVDGSRISPEAMKLIRNGVKLAKEYNHKENGVVRLKDLFGGLLQGYGFTTAFFSAALLPAEIDQVIDTYRGYLEAPETVSLHEVFSRVFPRPEPPTSTSDAIQMAVSGFSADTRTEKDLVGIGAEVDAFAYLIANKDLQPPLAIGLFGDWGSGKTYFMQSVKARVHQITEEARKSTKPQGKINVFKHIVQIEFNAWHYVEGELWASLVETIFQNLETSDKEEPSLLQQRQRYWLDKLETLRKEQSVVQILKSDLEELVNETNDEIRRLGAERTEKLAAVQELKGVDILSATEIPKEVRKELNTILKDWGVTETYTKASEYIQAFTGLTTVLERGNVLTVALRRRGWRWTLGTLAVAVSGPLMSLGISYLKAIEVPAVTNALASISTFLGALTILIKAASMKLSQAITQVEQAQTKLGAQERQIQQQYAQQIADLEAEIDQINQEYQRNQAQGDKLSQQIKAVENEIQQITPRRVLLDFIGERAGSQDYSKKLGIAALIRRDFSQLSELIKVQNEDFIENDDGQIQENSPMINRIVLYIDDLDRCPSERVVQVLQAAHLLLAFPLFVVVIGVDARWLSQSLQTHYEGLLAENGLQEQDSSDESDLKPATPENYLEKIFQIPFWIKPLLEPAKVRIVQGLVEKSIADRDKSGGDEGDDPDQEAESRVSFQPGENLRQYKPAEKPDPETPGLKILNRELKFMEALGPMLGQTPRSVKRFVNVYWLMKSVAMSQDANFVEEGQYADFKQVLLLLAILTGTPAISRDFFKHLLDEDRIEPDPAESPGPQTSGPKTLRQVKEQLKQRLKTHSRVDLAEYHQDLKRLESWLSEHEDGAWLNLETQTFQRWLPVVTRFSYEMA